MLLLLWCAYVLLVEPFSLVSNECKHGGRLQDEDTLNGEAYNPCMVELSLAYNLDEAVDMCNRISGTLPFIHCGHNNTQVRETLNNTFLSDYGPEDITDLWLPWKGGGWIDGSPVDYNKYQGAGTPEYLVYDRRTGTWIEPRGPAGVLCFYPRNHRLTCPDECFDEWYYSMQSDTCYFVRSDLQLLNFEVTGIECIEEFFSSYISLPTPESHIENEILYDFVMSNEKNVEATHFWLYYWTNASIFREPYENCFNWITGEPMHYKNFLTEPDPHFCLGHDDLCVAMILGTKDGGKWEVVDCLDSHVAICSSSRKGL